MNLMLTETEEGTIFVTSSFNELGTEYVPEDDDITIEEKIVLSVMDHFDLKIEDICK